MILQGDCFELIKNVESKSVDLILVDPPYLISRDSNFNKYSDETSKEMANKYGNISIDFGEWDKGELDWDFLFKEYNRVLRDGGTLIIFYDVWKSTEIKTMADKYKFKQPRVCQWQKSNPVPINSKLNYLSNAITGTTAHACILTDRKYTIMERDEKYFEIIKSRVNSLSTNLESNDIK